MNGSINCTYWIGKRSLLQQDWQDYNVFMTRTSKLYYVEKGEIIIQIYGQTITVGAGELMLIPVRTVHSFWMPEGGYAEKSWCHFSLRSTAGEFFSQFVLEPVVKVQDCDYVKNLFEQLFSSGDMPAPRKDLVATTAICSLVQYYFEHSKVSVKDVAANRDQRVIDYIDEHYMEKISLERLAEIACCSPKYLSKRFRATIGLPPIRYLNLVRFERAKYLLQFSDEPIGQIMEKCGFTDAAYFSRSFRRLFGNSPQTFRDLYQTSIDRR